MPTIDARIHVAGRVIDATFLIDTASTYTLVPYRDLGICFQHPPSFVEIPGTETANGHSLRGVKLCVKIEFPDFAEYTESQCWVTRDLSWPLLGGKTFFHHYGLVNLNWPSHKNGKRFVLFQRKQTADSPLIEGISASTITRGERRGRDV